MPIYSNHASPIDFLVLFQAKNVSRNSENPDMQHSGKLLQNAIFSPQRQAQATANDSSVKSIKKVLRGLNATCWRDQTVTVVLYSRN